MQLTRLTNEFFSDLLSRLPQTANVKQTVNNLRKNYAQIVNTVESTLRRKKTVNTDSINMQLSTINAMLTQPGVKEEELSNLLGAIEQKLGITIDKKLKQNFVQNVLGISRTIGQNTAFRDISMDKEKLRRVFDNIFAAIDEADITKAVIGLTGKQTTGIVVDEFVDPIRTLAEATSLGEEQKLGYRLKSAQLKAKNIIAQQGGDTQQVQRARQTFTREFQEALDALHYFPLSITKSPEMFTQAEKVYDILTSQQGGNTAQIYNQITGQFSTPNEVTQEIQATTAHQLKIQNMETKYPLLANVFNIDMLKSDFQRQADAQVKQAQRMQLTQNVPQITEQIKTPYRNVADVLDDLHTRRNAYVTELQQQQGLDKNTAQNMSDFLQFQAFYNENTIDFLNLLQTDLQKTVDKSNKNVIIGTLLNLMTSKQNILDQTEETNTTIRQSLYNAIFNSQTQQFKGQQIVDMVKDYKQNKIDVLHQLNFSQQFIQQIEDIQDIAGLFNKQSATSDIDPLSRLIQHHLQQEFQATPGLKNLSAPMQRLYQVDILQRYIDIPQTLGGDTQQAQTLKRMYAQSQVQLNVQDKTRQQFRQLATQAIDMITDEEPTSGALGQSLELMFGKKVASQYRRSLQRADTQAGQQQYKALQKSLSRLNIRLPDLNWQEGVEGQDITQQVSDALRQYVQTERDVSKLTDLILFSDVYQTMPVSPYFETGKLALAYLQNNRQRLASLRSYMNTRLSFIESMDVYRLARGMKGGKDVVQRVIKSGTNYEQIQRTGYFGRLLRSKANQGDSLRYLYPSFFRQFFGDETETYKSLQLAKGKLTEDILELGETRQEEQASKMLNIPESSQMLQPGLYINQGLGGGLYIMLNKPGSPIPTHQEQYNTLSELFLSPKAAYQAAKQRVGQYQPELAGYMYQQQHGYGELAGLPIGPYQGTNQELKPEVWHQLRKRITEAQRINFKPTTETTWTDQFDLQRQVILASNKIQEMDYNTYFILNEVLNTQEIAKLLNTSTANELGIDINNLDIVEFMKARFGISQNQLYSNLVPKLSQASIDYFTQNFLTNPQAGITQREIVRQLSTTQQRMVDLLDKIYTTNVFYMSDYMRKDQYYFLDVQRMQDTLLTAKRFTYNGIPMGLVPHHLVDPISLSQQGEIGSAPQLKPFGFTADYITHTITPVQQARDAVRVTNKYLQQHPYIKITQPQRTPEMSDHEWYTLQRTYDVYSQMQKERFYSVDLWGKRKEEFPGVYTLTAIMDKTDFTSDVLQALGLENVSLAGDAYLANQDWFKILRTLTRNAYGQISERQLPEHLKVTGVARSKGILINRFKNLWINIGQSYYPVALIMNDQGKRINKSAEFLLGHQRLKEFMQREMFRQNMATRGTANINIPQNLSELNTTLENLKKEFQQQSFRLYRMTEPGKFEEIAGIPSVKAILQKTYFYTAMSHEPKIVGTSIPSIQTSVQIKQLQLTSMMGSIVASESAQPYNFYQQRQNLGRLALESLISTNIQQVFTSQPWNRRRELATQVQQRFRKLPVPASARYTDNTAKLRALQNLYRRLGTHEQAFFKTQDLLEELQSAMQGPKITLPTGTSVVQLAGQKNKLIDLVGKEIAVLQPSHMMFEQIQNRLPRQTRGRIYRILNQLGGFAETTDSDIKFLRLNVPQLVAKSGTTHYLPLEAETLANFFQGQYSILYAQKETNYLTNALKFYTGRATTLSTMQVNKLTHGLIKKRGTSFYLPHQTQRNDLGGINLPADLMIEMMQSQARLSDTVVDQRQVRSLFSHVLSNDVIDNYLKNAAPSTFLDYQQGAYVLRHDKERNKLVVQISQQLSQSTSGASIKRMVLYNLPFIHGITSANDIDIEIKDNIEHAKDVAAQWLQQLKGFKYQAEKQRELGIGYGRMLKSVQPTRITSGAGMTSAQQLLQAQRASVFGELYQMTARHPIGGNIPIARVMGFSQGGTVDVPRIMAEAIAGDDDGDKINALPFILIDASVYKSKMATPTKYGLFLPTFYKMKRATDIVESDIVSELRHLAQTGMQRINKPRTLGI